MWVCSVQYTTFPHECEDLDEWHADVLCAVCIEPPQGKGFLAFGRFVRSFVSSCMLVLNVVIVGGGVRGRRGVFVRMCAAGKFEWCVCACAVRYMYGTAQYECLNGRRWRRMRRMTRRRGKPRGISDPRMPDAGWMSIVVGMWKSVCVRVDRKTPRFHLNELQGGREERLEGCRMDIGGSRHRPTYRGHVEQIQTCLCTSWKDAVGSRHLPIAGMCHSYSSSSSLHLA